MTINKESNGHLAALLTIIIWGTTFISTKILLTEFKPVEILFLRFIIGYAALLIICPHIIKAANIKQELVFASAGLCGICLYYLLENIALTYTSASNVGVIISIAPFFTVILSYLTSKGKEKLRISFFVGFIVSMSGICLISFEGASLEFNPAGDILAIAAAVLWACYSVLMKKISDFGYSTVLATRRVFFYGIIFMMPALYLFDFNLNLKDLIDLKYLFNIVFLGIGASALCFVTWNFAVKVLGAVKTSIYIYLVPVITVAASIIVLHEVLTLPSVIGIFLTLIGLFLSEIKTNDLRLKIKKYRKK